MNPGTATILLDLGAVTLLTAIFHRIGGIRAEVDNLKSRFGLLRERIGEVEEEIET